MAYFGCLGLILGIYLMAASIFVFFFTDQYKKLGNRFMPHEKPLWYSIVGHAMAALIFYTWYRCWNALTPLTFAVTAVFSLMLIKIIFVTFHYRRFREFAKTFLATPNSILKILAILFMAVGICLTAIGTAL